MYHSQHSQGLGEGLSQLGVMEFHFIVKAFFSKDCCALWGHDGMGVCDTERSHLGWQEGRLPYQRGFSY